MNFSYWEKESILKPADNLVIGMGLTGLQTAIELKERHPSSRVMLCDRFAWSLGASTRNAGFACFANVSEILDDLKNHSEKEVFELAARRYRGIQKLLNKTGQREIDYVEKGSCEIFTSANQKDLESGLDALQGINAVLHAVCGLDNVFYFSNSSPWANVKGCIRNKFEGQVHTGKLYSILLQKARMAGIELMGGMELLSWENVKEGVEVQFRNGVELRSRRLFLCSNAFASQHSELDVRPARGQVILTEVLRTLPCEGLHHFDKGYYYWRDLDGRILLGGARNLDSEAEESFEMAENQKINAELRRFLFDQIIGNEVQIEYQWSGIMGIGSKQAKTPIVKKLGDHCFAAVRLGGMGLALSSIISEDLVDLADNRLRPSVPNGQ
jgi:glycine/D-amino acid oxidase-like deaminating enzyme